jgi:hypothetical protein
MSWKHPFNESPPLDKIVLLKIKNGDETEIRTAVRRIEHPGFEDTFSAYSYWDDPYNEGQEWEMDNLLEWTDLPE